MRWAAQWIGCGWVLIAMVTGSSAAEGPLAGGSIRDDGVVTSRLTDAVPVARPQPPVPPEQTLPKVIVRPEQQADAAPTVAVPADAGLESWVSYPRLRDLQLGQGGRFGENTGALRSGKSLFDSARAASVVTGQQLTEQQSADMFQALQTQVGVLMQSTAAGQASPYVRGVTGQQVLILIDGVRLNNSIFRLGPNQYFNTIDPGMVDHIEVVRGAGSVLWGSDAIGGVINVVTRGADLGSVDAGRWGGEFTQYYNTSNGSPYSRLNVEGWLGGMAMFGGGSYQNVRDLDTGWSFGRQPGTNYESYSGDIKLNYLLSDRDLLTVSLQHYEQDNLPRSDRYPGFPGDANNSNSFSGARFFDPQQRDLAYIRYQAVDLRFLDALTATASYTRQREIQTRGVPTARFQETDVESVGVNLVGAVDLDRLGKLTVGTDWYHDDVDSNFGGSASGPIIPDDAYYERFGAFLNWDVLLVDRLNAVAGLRYELIDLAATPVVNVGGVPAATHISPNYADWIASAGLVYEVNSDLHLVGSISEGFRAPNLDELTANNPNVLQNGFDLPSLGLVPEHTVTYEAGVKIDTRRLRSQTFVYWTDLNNNIVAISGGGNTFRRANQDSLVQGVEMDGEYLLGDGWSAYGNFWYTYGKNLVTQAPLSRVPPTQGIAGLRWRSRCGHRYANLYTWLVRRQDRLDPVRDGRDERIPSGGTPGFGTLNLRLGTAWGEHDQHRLSLSLENLTDQPYLVHGSGVFGTGFTARFGYQWIR